MHVLLSHMYIYVATNKIKRSIKVVQTLIFWERTKNLRPQMEFFNISAISSRCLRMTVRDYQWPYIWIIQSANSWYCHTITNFTLFEGKCRRIYIPYYCIGTGQNVMINHQKTIKKWPPAIYVTYDIWIRS